MFQAMFPARTFILQSHLDSIYGLILFNLINSSYFILDRALINLIIY